MNISTIRSPNLHYLTYPTAVTPKDSKFRPDIAGLRAVAVMLVMLAHFQIPGFGFGFVGVDIFFVISGFLITRLLYQEFISSGEGDPRGSFLSLLNFYARRIRRLLPAALVVIVLVNVISFFLYNPQVRDALFGNSKWALFFLANVSFLRSESDYFQQSSEPSMLQHYWSLSVEEQFYFIWPLLFLIAASFHKLKIRNRYFRFDKRILTLIFFITLLSYLFLQFGFDFAPTEVYFSIFTRAWELGAGAFFGILAFHKRKEWQFSKFELFTPLGLAYVFSFIYITENNWARLIVVPVVATGFYLYAGQNQVNSRYMSRMATNFLQRPLLFIGGISYSLYLIHWPIYILASHLNLLDGLLPKMLLIPISIVSGFLLWKYVEVPCQKLSLPRQAKWEKPVFAFIKERRPVIGILTLSIIGSLYLVTYPSVTDRLLYSDSSIQKLADDPNLRRFADYQVDSPQNSDTSGDLLSAKNESTSVTANISLTELLKQHQLNLKTALSRTEVPISLRESFTKIAGDISGFEKTPCPTEDVVIPRNCSIPGTGGTPKTIGLIGDSKMAMFADGLIKHFKTKGWRIEPMIMTGCTPSAPRDKFQKNCTARIEWVKDHVSKTGFDVLIIAEYPAYLGTAKDLTYRQELFKKLKQNSKQLIIFNQIHAIPNSNTCIKPDFTYTQSCSVLVPGELQSLSNFLQFYKSQTDAKTIVVDTKQWYMSGDLVPLIVNDAFVFRDGVHLTDTFVKSIQPIINATLDSIIS